MKKIASLLLLLQFCCIGIVSATPLKPEELFPTQEFFAPKLSPDGSRLLVYSENEVYGTLTIYDTNTFKVLGVVQMGQDNFAFNLNWVNDDRIVYQLKQRFTGNAFAQITGEIFAVNYDGSDSEILYGYRAGYDERSGASNVKRSRKSSKAIGWIEHLLPDDEKYILISEEPFSRDGARNDTLLRLNVYTGRTKKIAPTVPLDQSKFYFTTDGEPLFVSGINEGETVTKIYKFDDDEWVEFLTVPKGSTFEPLAAHPDGKSLYLLSDNNHEADKVGLYKLNIKTKESTLIYENERVDLNTGVLGTQGELIAVEMHDGYPSYVLIPGESKDKKIFKQLTKKFQGNNISIVSSNEKGDKAIVEVTLDTMPNLYYLFDLKTDKSTLLFKRLEVDSKRLTYMNPISFESFDGRRIDGYLTSKTPKEAIATVVLVHGGPVARDFFRFNETVQLLASQGYAVLQINYRGSYGYGSEFERAGYKHWGDDIQKDILAGVDWAIKKGYTDKSKVCIMGASFGAYSAMMTSIMQPDTFKCIVANAGVYDLGLLYEKGDAQRYTARSF